MSKQDMDNHKKSNHKPIFIVSNKKEIMNYKQKVVYAAPQVYQNMLRNFGQLKTQVVCPLQTSIEFDKTGLKPTISNYKRLASSQGARKRIFQHVDNNGSQETIRVNEISPTASAMCLSPVKKKQNKSHRKNRAKRGFRTNKKPKGESKIEKNTLRLFTPKHTKILDLVQVRKFQGSISQDRMNRLNMTKSCYISPKYDHNTSGQNDLSNELINNRSQDILQD